MFLKRFQQRSHIGRFIPTRLIVPMNPKIVEPEELLGRIRGHDEALFSGRMFFYEFPDAGRIVVKPAPT